MMATARQAQPGRRVLVLGMGITGASCARWLAVQGRDALFADTRPVPPALAEIRAALPEAGVIAGALPAGLPDGIGEVIVSPGVDLDLPLLRAARANGIPVRSDIDLFAAAARAPLVAVTGSNGKSTVTALTGALLAGAGLRVGVGGNLGTPALDLLDDQAEAYVLELSSFQLERSAPLACAAAVLLNVSPDHLDRHRDLAAYAAAKARVYLECGTAVVNRAEPGLWRGLVPGGRRISFGLDQPAGEDFGLVPAAGGEWLAQGERLLLPAAELALAGRHNLSNALAALALASALGVDPAATLDPLRGFAGLPHRMQVISRAAGLLWIDDSKATNVGAAVTAIGGTPGALVLVAGGDGKGQDFAALADALRGRDCLALLLGRDRGRIAEALAGVCAVRLVDDLDGAVAIALAQAPPGATVLLAPACSSLDMYRDYAERGELFRAAVQAQAGGGR
jgi:UDP-N-acetylmuramoylalanine--D-glutamate ligase